MRLKLLLPTEVLIDVAVTRIIAEGGDGSFCLLPRHIDFVSALVPGLLSFVPVDGDETFVAVDEGVLVKCADQVLVSARHALIGPDLGKLRQMIDDQFRALDERERMARSAVVKLEADFIRRFIEMEKV